MTIEIDENSYIVGIWFSSNPKTENNWLAGIIRDPENSKKFKGWFRFRYIRDNKIFDSADEKKWTNFTSKEEATDEEMISLMQLAQKELKPGYPEMDQIIVQGDIKKLFNLSKEKKWMFIKEVKVDL